MTEGATLIRVLFYKECEACSHRFTSVFRNAKCPRCSARSKVYGIQELTPGREEDPGQVD